MKHDVVAFIPDAKQAGPSAAAAKAAGADGWFTAEVGYDPFVTCAVAASQGQGLEIGTGIAVAFGRTPMTVAYAANDLQGLTEGRFILGLGTQIKPHIVKRYGMPWSKPAARMEEFIAAMKAIWASWRDGTRLDFRGDFYEHTLMTPMFAGADHGFGDPKIALAAVGPLMTRLVGRRADVFLAHAFGTEAFFRNRSMPALEEGLRESGRAREDLEVAITEFVITGRTQEERAFTETLVRGQLSFYGSTPAYRPVFEEHGWGDLQTELNTMSKQGLWQEMGEMLPEEVLDAFALVVDDPDDVGHAFMERWGDVADRAALYPTWQPDAQAVQAFRAAIGADG